MMYGYNYGYGPDFGYGLYHILGWVFWFLIIVLVVRVIRAHKHGKSWRGLCSGRCGEDSAMTLLRERYVKGEIDHAEFEAKKKALMN